MNPVIERVQAAFGGGLGLLLRPLIFGLVALAGIPLVLATCFTTIEPGEIGVRQDNVFGGGISETDLTPGYHLRVLGMHRMYRLDEHFDFVHFADDDQLRIRTRDNNTVRLDVSVPYHIVPGEAHYIVMAGLHVGDAYKERTYNTTIGVLRERLAAMSAPDFFDTSIRLRVTNATLASLNEALAEFHVEAERIYIRAVYYGEDYEDQQQRIQLLQQETLLDRAQEEVSARQQLLDNYNQQTEALVNARNAWWDERLAVIERVYGIGLTDEDLESLVAAALAGRGLVDDPEDASSTVRAEVRDELAAHYRGEAYEIGVEGINADTNRQVAALQGRASSLQARYAAEADRVIAQIQLERDRRVNELLSSAGGRALVALEAAERLHFADRVVFPADGVPFIFDLDGLARLLMGR